MKIISRIIAALAVSTIIMLASFMPAQATSVTDSASSPSPVIDGGDIFSSDEEAALIQVIENNYDTYDLHFVVETIPSLNGQNLESLSLARANELGVGEAESNNGVLIYIARDDRKVRFELGSGVTNSVTDSEMSNIIDSVVTPSFKAEDYISGVINGMSEVGLEYTRPASQVEPSTMSDGMAITMIIVSGLGGLILLGLIGYCVQDMAKSSLKDRRTDKAYKKQRLLLDEINRFTTKLKQSHPEVTIYKGLPNMKSRLQWLESNYPEIHQLLEEHSNPVSSEIVDNKMVNHLGGNPNDYNKDSLIKLFKIQGKGIEAHSLDEVNVRIDAIEKPRLEKIAKEKQDKARAKEVWAVLPESAKREMRSAKSDSERKKIYARYGNKQDYDAYHVLLLSMYMTSHPASSGSSSIYNGSSSSNSSSSSSSYDSNSYGGGSFDGGGSSGSW